MRYRPIPTKHRKNTMFLCDPLNLPLLERPGVYILVHIPSGRSYVGSTKNIAVRLYEHMCHGSRVASVQQAVINYGNHEFWMEPLYYAIDPTTTRKEAKLHFVEHHLIDVYDSINHGWNQPMPDVSILMKTTEARAKRAAKEASPETKARRSAEMNKRYANPEYHANMAKQLRKITVEREAKPRKRIKHFYPQLPIDPS